MPNATKTPGKILRSNTILGLILTLIPWAVFWALFQQTTNPWLSTTLPFLLMLLIVIDRTLHHHPSWLDIGSLTFLGLSVGLTFGQVPWFLRWGSVIGSAFQGLLWLSSPGLYRPSHLSGNAEKALTPKMKTSWIGPTNSIIHLMWGYQFILLTNLGILAQLLTKLKTPLTICQYALVGLSIFLTWVIQNRSGTPHFGHPRKTDRQIKTAAIIGMALNAALILQMIRMG